MLRSLLEDGGALYLGAPVLESQDSADNSANLWLR